MPEQLQSGHLTQRKIKRKRKSEIRLTLINFVFSITAIGQTAPTQQDMSAFSSTKTFKSAKSSHKSMRSTPEKAKSDVGKSTPEMILVK